MSTELHTCSAEGCDKQIASHLLMCLPHWRMVPKALQIEVYATYRRWSRSRLMDARKAYVEAVRQARTAVREKEIRRQMRGDSKGDVLDLE